MQDHGLRSRRCGALELALVRLVMATAAAVLLAACGRQAAVPAAPPVPEVGVLKVEPRPAPLSIELVGDVRALREVELRPRVTGVVERQMFTPGQMVREGQPLFLLDTRALDSGVADAQARLIEAEAQLQRAQQDVARYQPLLADDAIARQTYDQAVAAQKQAESLVESRREGVTRARIDRGFAEVRAPVTGQIGLQKVEVGGLASAGQTVLAVVSTLDPVVVYFSVSETEYLEFARRLEDAGRSLRREPIRPLDLLLADGSQYRHAGRFDFADRAINPQTGTLTLRAVFPNPEQLLRPGMTGRVRLVYDVAEAAIVIPQKAVTELLGRQFVAVVRADGKVEQRPVRTGARLGDQWLIEDGLRPGDTVVVEGVQKARAGAAVKAVPVVVTGAAPGNAPGAAGAAPAPAGAAKK
jgi:membrane fusion protein (multidrug efflux system)